MPGGDCSPAFAGYAARMTTCDPRRWLLFGATGMVGEALLLRLQAAGAAVVACTRGPAPPNSIAGARWLRASLAEAPAAEALCTRMPDVIACAGPLDAFADWLQRHPPPAQVRVLALSSLSAEWKRSSRQPSERALALRLLTAEQALLDTCLRAGAEATILRCGLIWERLDGEGRDRSLSPLLRLASRWRVLPWPRAARGLRQPVHADDIAAALMSASARSFAQPLLSLPGPHSLDWPSMLQRSFESSHPSPRLLSVPMPGLAPLLRRLASRSGRLGEQSAVLARLYENQTAVGEGWSQLCIQPRGFGATKPVAGAS